MCLFRRPVLAAVALLVTAGQAPAWQAGIYSFCGPRYCNPYVPVAAPLGIAVAPSVAMPLTFGYAAPMGYAGYSGYAVSTGMPFALPSVGVSATAQAPTFGLQAQGQPDLSDAIARLRSEVSGLKNDVQQLGRIAGTHTDAIADLQRRVDALERPKTMPAVPK